MVTMTLTEFNQNVSRATRMARVEDVIITERGVEAFQLRALPTRHGRIDSLRRAGLIRPARPAPGAMVFPTLDVDRDTARAMIADFEADRDPLAY